jgi:hypothetical protein
MMDWLRGVVRGESNHNLFEELCPTSTGIATTAAGLDVPAVLWGLRCMYPPKKQTFRTFHTLNCGCSGLPWDSLQSDARNTTR